MLPEPQAGEVGTVPVPTSALELQSARAARAAHDAAVEDLRADFPGARVVPNDPRYDVALRSKRRQMMTDYCSLLWEGTTGSVCMGIGFNGSFNGGGHYSFARFSQTFYVWPDDGDRLIDTAMHRAPTADVFIGPMVRNEASRKKGTGLSSRYVWADCDGPWTEARGARTAELWSVGSFVVASGSGRHVYIALDEPLPAAAVERLNRGLAVALDGDSKWDETALLRPPGTWWHKGHARGAGSEFVRWALP